jgi:arylsulfatase A-like enzyme
LFAGGIDWQRDGVTVEEEGYSTEMIAREAMRLIEKNSGQPYFLLVSFNAPHTPIQGPGGRKPEHNGRKTYLEMVRSMDTAIGQIIETLVKQGDLTNTVVIFASDNGGQEPVPFWMEWLIPPTADGFAANGALRADKGKVYEGGVRVPASIWWPGTIESEQLLEQPLHIADLLPTLAEIIGFSLPELDGESQWQSLRLHDPRKRQPMIVANMGSEAMIDWPWKLVKKVSLPFVPKFLASENYYLYNLGLDPGETNDLAQNYPKVFEQMTKDLQSRPRRQVIELDLSQDSGSFGGEVNRNHWAESVLD